MSVPEFVTISNLIIDDIVLSDGRSFMNTLGGSGTHALVGMRAWSDQLGYVAYHGDDFDPQHQHFLEHMGIDLRGIVFRPGLRTARAWQLFEPNDLRIEIFRSPFAQFVESKPTFDTIPPDYLQARGIHLCWGTPTEMSQLITQLRAANPHVRLVGELALADSDGTFMSALSMLGQLDLFAPDRDEARALAGSDDISVIFDRLLSAGARMVALRMGARGSLVGTAAGEFYRVPAVPPTALVDVTGAGNAYCGGFLVGLGWDEELGKAIARAAASASFAIEQLGVPTFDDAKLAEAQRRLEWALERIQVWRNLDEF